MNTVLKNLLRYPPVEGSRDAHEAWKQNVRTIGFSNGSPSVGSDDFWFELCKPGYVTRTCARLAQAHLTGME